MIARLASRMTTKRDDVTESLGIPGKIDKSAWKSNIVADEEGNVRVLRKSEPGCAGRSLSCP